MVFLSLNCRCAFPQQSAQAQPDRTLPKTSLSVNSQEWHLLEFQIHPPNSHLCCFVVFFSRVMFSGMDVSSQRVA
jgi:hypothetical protein